MLSKSSGDTSINQMNHSQGSKGRVRTWFSNTFSKFMKKNKTPKDDETHSFNSGISNTLIHGEESQDLGVIERGVEAFTDEPTVEEVKDNSQDDLVIEDIGEPLLDLYISHRSKKRKENDSVLMVYDEPIQMNKHRKTTKKVPYLKNDNIQISITGEDEVMQGPPDQSNSPVSKNSKRQRKISKSSSGKQRRE